MGPHSLRKRSPLPVALAVLSLLAGCSSSSGTGYPDDLHIITREMWGWKPETGTHPTHTISFITIHHGGEDFPPDKDPVEYLRHLQEWSRQEKKWMDIPYHYMIDLKGNIYETRPIEYPGDTNTEYDPTGHALICVMGNYENQIVSSGQLQSLIRLTAYLAARYHVPVEKIRGHKDYAETLCPGKDLYRYLQDGTIQRGVSALLNGAQ